MHELPITENILKIVNEEADKNNAKKILSIKLIIGELTGYLAESIQFYFDIVSKGTKCEGAKLIISNVLVKKKCLICKSEVDISTEICPVCQGKRFTLSGGREFYIDSIEIE